MLADGIDGAVSTNFGDRARRFVPAKGQKDWARSADYGPLAS